MSPNAGDGRSCQALSGIDPVEPVAGGQVPGDLAQSDHVGALGEALHKIFAVAERIRVFQLERAVRREDHDDVVGAVARDVMVRAGRKGACCGVGSGADGRDHEGPVVLAAARETQDHEVGARARREREDGGGGVTPEVGGAAVGGEAAPFAANEGCRGDQAEIGATLCRHVLRDGGGARAERGEPHVPDRAERFGRSVAEDAGAEAARDEAVHGAAPGVEEGGRGIHREGPGGAPGEAGSIQEASAGALDQREAEAGLSIGVTEAVRTERGIRGAARRAVRSRPEEAIPGVREGRAAAGSSLAAAAADSTGSTGARPDAAHATDSTGSPRASAAGGAADSAGAALACRAAGAAGTADSAGAARAAGDGARGRGGALDVDGAGAALAYRLFSKGGSGEDPLVSAGKHAQDGVARVGGGEDRELGEGACREETCEEGASGDLFDRFADLEPDGPGAEGAGGGDVAGLVDVEGVDAEGAGAPGGFGPGATGPAGAEGGAFVLEGGEEESVRRAGRLFDGERVVGAAGGRQGERAAAEGGGDEGDVGQAGADARQALEGDARRGDDAGAGDARVSLGVEGADLDAGFGRGEDGTGVFGDLVGGTGPLDGRREEEARRATRGRAAGASSSAAGASARAVARVAARGDDLVLIEAEAAFTPGDGEGERAEREGEPEGERATRERCGPEHGGHPCSEVDGEARAAGPGAEHRGVARGRVSALHDG